MRHLKRTAKLGRTGEHRNAMLATLRPEQIPVAEQLLRGGLQAVRQAIATQNAGAKAAGKPLGRKSPTRWHFTQ